MKTGEFVDLLKKNGIVQVSAVPCSVIQGIIQALEQDEDIHYIPMSREDNLISWAAGVYLAGSTPFIMMQNSGLGNAIDTLISLPMLYRMPLVMLITWRGFEKKDEVQHWTWGEVQNPLLDALKVPYIVLEKNNLKIRADLERAVKMANESKGPVILILKRGNYIDEKN